MSRGATDLKGRTFDRLTVMERDVNTWQGHAQWKCICVCGNTKTIQSRSLLAGHTTSCGCKRKDKKYLKKNMIAVYSTYAEIILADGSTVEIDREDVPRVNEHYWRLHDTKGYVKNRNEMLHWFLIGKPPKGMVTDHIDKNVRNNRKSNLRHCTYSDNALNRKTGGQ